MVPGPVAARKDSIETGQTTFCAVREKKGRRVRLPFFIGVAAIGQ